jgi:hypothetical protein
MEDMAGFSLSVLMLEPMARWSDVNGKTSGFQATTFCGACRMQIAFTGISELPLVRTLGSFVKERKVRDRLFI